MIVPMQKLLVAVRRVDRDTLLTALRDAGVIHLVPVDPERARVDDETLAQLRDAERALQVLSALEPRGDRPTIEPGDIVAEVHDIQRRAAEQQSRLTGLYRQLEQIRMWGDLRLEQVAQLQQAGLHVEFFGVPSDSLGQITAECVQRLGDLPNQQAMVAVIQRSGEAELPEGAVPLPLPATDAPTIRAEAAEIDAARKADQARLAQLAHLTSEVERELSRVRQEADWTLALNGAAEDEDLFAVQGWIPEGHADEGLAKLEASGMAALKSIPAEDDELPPTLIESPKWARPIEGLFGVLGTVPGYREFDVSIPFLIALPLFTAMLISDAAYGALLLFGPALAYPWATKALGTRFTQLLMVVGAVSMVWGTLTNAFFGFPVFDKAVITVGTQDAAIRFMMELSFTIGAIHLSLAQLWQAVREYPHLRFLNKIGWAIFIWGMYGVVKFFVLKSPMTMETPWPYLLMSGAALAILFASPCSNPLRMVGMGLAQFPLSMLSAFSDVMSYVRLMAVGLASSVLAVSFNNLALDSGFWPLAVIILVFGHSLNMGLGLIAMFAHGVRLNMLEFGNNLGLEWTGYAFRPFAHHTE
jgi:V/A-type H+-transporting ATPase subunit I